MFGDSSRQYALATSLSVSSSDGLWHMACSGLGLTFLRAGRPHNSAVPGLYIYQITFQAVCSLVLEAALLT